MTESAYRDRIGAEAYAQGMLRVLRFSRFPKQETITPDVVKMHARCEVAGRTGGDEVPRGLVRFGARTTQGSPKDAPLRAWIKELIRTCLGRGAIVGANEDTHGHTTRLVM